MQARTAARELALILFSQFDKEISKYKTKEFEDIILKSVRTLTNNASEDLKLAVGHLVEMKEFIDDYEANHQTNLERPLNVSNVPVPLPMTSDMSGRIDEMLLVAEKAFVALEIAEMTTLEEKSDVKEFTLKLAQEYKTHNAEIDGYIKEYAIGWDFSRLVKMDKDILRIAIAEMIYVNETPDKVVIDEAIELAKKYSTDDSSSFINGILAKIVDVKKHSK